MKTSKNQSKLHRIFRYFIISAWMTSIGHSLIADHHEHLIVFTQTGTSDVDHTFQQQIPELKRIAEENQVEFKLVDVVEKGAPPEVTITPLIVFQNHVGRSIYQGRSNTLERVGNFIRTSRYVPQGKVPNTRVDIPVRRIERTRVWAPLKIAPVTGTPPGNYNHSEFETESIKALTSGFKQFKLEKRAELHRTDRGFYFDFYPWLSDDGTLFLSLAVFSQFHCKKPVFELKKEPLTGPWAERDNLFRTAAAIMEDAVAASMKNTNYGDGFDPVGPGITQKSWDELGLTLPVADETKAHVVPANFTIPSSWILDDSATSDPPMIQFRFPPPLDNYSGTVTRGRAKIRLATQNKIEGGSGFFQADPTVVTMGEADLDDALQGSLFLDTKKFPVSSFKIESMRGDGQNLAFSQVSPVNVAGTFTLKGQSIPLSPSMEFEPIVNRDGNVRLLIRGGFEINVRNFKIEEAEGPEPANHTLLVNYHFVMRPVAK